MVPTVDITDRDDEETEDEEEMEFPKCGVCPYRGRRRDEYPCNECDGQEAVMAKKKEKKVVAKKNAPKKDGSGKGTRANRGRGGCATTKENGQGSNRK